MVGAQVVLRRALDRYFGGTGRRSAHPSGALLLAVAVLAVLGCERSSPGPSVAGTRGGSASAPMPRPVETVAGPVAGLEPLRVPAGDRIVAVGDLHGDLAATRAALKLAQVIDDGDRWIGGTTMLVQTGDQLDRGDDEQAILDLLERLRDEAAKAGGAVVALNGNHEVMNAIGDFRYVTAPGMHDFDGAAPLDDPRLASVPDEARARLAAFLPGGPYAKLLAKRHIAAIVGDTAFVHGGILPEHVEGLAKLDADVRAWLDGTSSDARVVERAMDEQGPLWTRDYAADETPQLCERLGRALALLGATRMVIGHTVQKGGITSACDARLWRIDVGLARNYGGPTQVLEIRGDTVKVLGGS